MNQPTTTRHETTFVGERHGTHLAIQHRTGKTLGKIISQMDSPDLVADVQISAIPVHADDRGFFMELARIGAPGIASYLDAKDKAQVQVSMTLAYPGTIKAIHYHFEQTDLWATVSGMLQVFLCDLRTGSKTFGAINTLYVGQMRPWEILIPPGVGHGYKVLGGQPAQMVYFTNRHFNPNDEGRLPFDHPEIGYDWETQRK